jgi:hypothetical protein
MEPDRVSPQQALASYAEALVPRGVVAVLGDSSTGVGELALQLGARAVHVWDPDEGRALARAAAAPRAMTVRPLARADLVRRDLDLVIVPDLGLFEDPAGLLADIRKMLGEEGVAIVTARNAEAASDGESTSFDYYELFDVVAAEFDFVRMVAQLPFRGVALVELGDDADGSAGVSVDTQLGDEGGTPDAFVALGSQRDVRLDPYAIVQLPRLPAPEIAEAIAPPPSPPAADARVFADLRARVEEVAALEGVLGDRNRRIAALTSELDELRAAVDASRLAAAEDLDELIARVDRAEQRATEQERELVLLGREESADEHEAIEGRLRERAQVIRELEIELTRRDRLVRDLAGALEEASAELAARPSPSRLGDDADDAAPLRRQLDAMALDLARREGEAQAAAWSNQELERRLAILERGERVERGASSTDATPPPTPLPSERSSGEPPSEARLAAALDELEALRLALVQEHDARVRAESRFGREAPPDPVDRTAG